MRQPLQSELPQVGGADRLPGNASPSIPKLVDTATLDLLSFWQEEDATADPAQVRAAEEDLAAFMKNLNESRTASGEPLVYP
jgi:hypothetical protein